MKDERIIKEARVELKEGLSLFSPEPINTASDAVAVMRDILRRLDREAVMILNLDVKGRPMSYNCVSIGSRNQSSAEPAEIFKAAILSNASSIVMLHNHPSGTLTPSQADHSITARIREAADLIGVPLMDHIIVAGGTGDYYSMRSSSYFKANTVPAVREGNENKYNTDHTEKIKELTNRLENGVKDLMSSDKYKQYLSFMAKMPQYSYRNSMLIMQQSRGEATKVASYSFWKDQGRYVKKGEHGLKILAPCFQTVEKQVTKAGENGEKETTTEEVQVRRFKVEHVFDISQTAGTEIPEITQRLSGQNIDFDTFLSIIKDISPVPISFEHIPGDANGYYSHDGRIVVDKDLSDDHKTHTLIHELAHAIVHNKENGEEKDAQKQRKEITAESIAYIVCAHYGLPTDEYSFGYLAGWSQDKDLKEFKSVLSVIQRTSSQIIDRIDAACLNITDKEKAVQSSAETLAENRTEKTVRSAHI